MSSLGTLPYDLLVMLSDYLHNIEDYMNLSSTCRSLREAMQRTSPRVILKLAAAQTRVFFRPSPHFLVVATARELGMWARQSEVNEQEFALKCQDGIDGLLDLAMSHCGLSMQRIRELHQARFDIINPITDIIDKCVGQQWYATPNFWDGGVDDAYTIESDPPLTLFHLAIYGELFGPDYAPFLGAAIQFQSHTHQRSLSIATRLEYVKYCIPDIRLQASHLFVAHPMADPRTIVRAVGPYRIVTGPNRPREDYSEHITALMWVLDSSRWKPHWKALLDKVKPNFGAEITTSNLTYARLDAMYEVPWRERFCLSFLSCQGLEALGMILPQNHDIWFSRVEAWTRSIEAMQTEPEPEFIVDAASGAQSRVEEYPCIMTELATCKLFTVAERTRRASR